MDDHLFAAREDQHDGLQQPGGPSRPDKGQCRADGFGPAPLVLGGGRIKGVQFLSGKPDHNDLHRLGPATRSTTSALLQLVDVVTDFRLVCPRPQYGDESDRRCPKRTVVDIPRSTLVRLRCISTIVDACNGARAGDDDNRSRMLGELLGSVGDGVVIVLLVAGQSHGERGPVARPCAGDRDPAPV